MKPGPRTREQLERLSKTWKQGEHLMVIGPTGSGKTTLARHIDQVRIDKGGFVVVLVGKLLPDATITNDYKGFVRWERMKKNPSPHENKILLWPKTETLKHRKDMEVLQKDVFNEAFDVFATQGRWSVHIDEGLYMSDPKHMNMSKDIAMLHALGRSSKLTVITLAQRPSHLPLIIYSSAAHAFIGRTREQVDWKRLSELGGRESGRELGMKINEQGRRDFLWIPVAPDWPAESVNLKE